VNLIGLPFSSPARGATLMARKLRIRGIPGVSVRV
jgi:hypothetical protein